MTSPEGWRTDPERAGAERWWNGVAWTDFTRPAPVDGAPPAPAGRQVIEHERIERALDDDTRLVGWIVASPYWTGPILVIASIIGDWIPLAVGFVVIVAALCLIDRWVLRRRGFPSIPRARWAALGAIGYLVGRRRALGHADTAQLWIVSVGWVVMAVPIGVFWAVRLGMSAAMSL